MSRGSLEAFGISLPPDFAVDLKLLFKSSKNYSRKTNQKKNASIQGDNKRAQSVNTFCTN